jgi:integrase
VRERHRKFHGPYRRGSKWRVVAVREDGARGVRSFDDEDAAKKWIANNARAYAKLAEVRTIAAAVEAYLAAQEHRMSEGELRESTVTREGYHLRTTLKLVEHGQLDLRKLDAQLAAQLYDGRRGAVDTHRNGLSVAKAFGAWCVTRGWLRTNPFAGVKGKGRRKRGKPQLRIEEARSFMSTCLELAPRDDGAVLALAYLLLGARAGEIVLRQVRDVDDGGRLLWIPDSKTQAGRRQLEVPEVLVRQLVRLTDRRPADAPLFRHAATRRRAQDWAREQVTRICKLAEVPRVTPHGLRGTAATLAAEAGATSQLVAATLGHASPAITEAAYIEPQRAAAAKRRATLRALVGAPSGAGPETRSDVRVSGSRETGPNDAGPSCKGPE